MYKRRPDPFPSTLLLFLDFAIIAYLFAYLLGLVPHNTPIDWLLDGIRKGMLTMSPIISIYIPPSLNDIPHIVPSFPSAISPGRPIPLCFNKPYQTE
jgi:hypothetical protein